MNPADFGSTVRQLRKRYGLTQEQLADAVGILQRTSIVNIEAGNQTPTLESATAILGALGHSLVVVPKGREPGAVERGLATARRVSAVEMLLAMRWRWDGVTWVPPGTER